MELPENQELIDTLILEGALVISGVSESGEILYKVTDKLKEMAPDLYEGFLDILKDSVMSLWQKGFVDMDITKANPLVSATEKVFNYDNWKDLDEEEANTMSALMKAFRGEV